MTATRQVFVQGLIAGFIGIFFGLWPARRKYFLARNINAKRESLVVLRANTIRSISVDIVRRQAIAE